MVAIYARHFTVEQLNDMKRFFDTPSGKAYAERSMLMFVEPEMMQGMQAFVPELMRSLPAIINKVEAATAHLPPPPKPRGDDAEPQDEDVAPATS